MTKFYFWLEKMLKAGEKVTELSAAAKLTALRSEQPQYVMDSFASISSYGPHGAVVHYSPTPETDTELKTDSLYPVSYTHLDVYKRQAFLRLS